MPIYPVTCTRKTCGHSADVFARVADRLAIRCPKCGAATSIDFGRIRVSAGDNTPAGREEFSITESVSRRHVKRLRQLMPKNGHLVADDGKVRFRTTQDAKAWRREREDNVRKAIARRGKDPDQVIAARAKQAREDVSN